MDRKSSVSDKREIPPPQTTMEETIAHSYVHSLIQTYSPVKK
jgi:hypothetical protein